MTHQFCLPLCKIMNGCLPLNVQKNLLQFDWYNSTNSVLKYCSLCLSLSLSLSLCLSVFVSLCLSLCLSLSLVLDLNISVGKCVIFLNYKIFFAMMKSQIFLRPCFFIFVIEIVNDIICELAVVCYFTTF